MAAGDGRGKGRGRIEADLEDIRTAVRALAVATDDLSAAWSALHTGIAGSAGMAGGADGAAFAADYDAIHLTVGGYLSTAGRAIQAGSAYTVLAGWDPDETWWLTDSPRRLGEPVTWLDTRDEEPFRWAPTTS